MSRERRDAFFAAFAVTADMRPVREDHIRALQPDELSHRSPVWMASVKSAWSRRPIQVARSGLSSSATASSRVRNEMSARSKRFWGMASTRWIDPACSGCKRAANLNIEWMAARRAFLVRALLWRSASRWSKNAPMSGASRSQKSSFEGSHEVLAVAKPIRRRNVSR
jgi:hypothetical protein